MVKKLSVGEAKAVHYNNDGSLLAVGLKNGEFILFSTSDWRIIAQKRDRGSMINDLRSVLSLKSYNIIFWSVNSGYK